MKKMKKVLLSTITLVIVGLVIASGASSVSIPNMETTPEDSGIVAHYLMVKSQPLDKKIYEKSTESLTFSSAQITSGDYDEYHPSAAGSPAGGFYAMMESSEDGAVWQPTLYGSTDGITWEALSTFLYDNAEFTDMDQNTYGTYGTFGAPPDSSGYLFLVYGEDPESSVYWDWSTYNFNEFLNNRIACYTFEGPEGDPGTWNFGAITFTGFNGYSTPNIEGCPFVFYQSSSAGEGLIGWLSGASAANCENVGSAMDLATNYHYAVYDRDPGTGTYELLVRKDNFGSWTYNPPPQDYWSHNFMTSKKVSNTTASLMYPSVAAYNNKVVVACQKGDDVTVFYSTNGFTTYKEVLIETSASYPEVEMAGGGARVIITYIKNDVLYFRISADGGVSWSDAEVVSDNQVNLNNRAAQLDEYNGKVCGVWEDTRGANIDIYFDTIYEIQSDPPGAPTINGPNSGEPGTSYDFVFNAVDPDGDQVKYIINWGDGNFTTTALNPSGTDVTESHTWSTGGSYTITTKAQDSFNLIGPETTKTIVIKKSKEINLPLFKFLQNYPNLLSILKYILGL